jgi:PilZ domain
MATGRTIRGFEGRMEKRLPIALIVQLTQAQDGPSPPRLELTFTDNVSAHGACVVSSRPWERRELMDVTSVKDRVTLRGKVIHCQRRPDNRYGVGLRFAEHAVAWPTYRTYAGDS